MMAQIGFWICIHCGKEHQVLTGGLYKCPQLGLEWWGHVNPDQIYEKSVAMTAAKAQQS